MGHYGRTQDLDVRIDTLDHAACSLDVNACFLAHAPPNDCTYYIGTLLSLDISLRRPPVAVRSNGSQRQNSLRLPVAGLGQELLQYTTRHGSDAAGPEGRRCANAS